MSEDTAKLWGLVPAAGIGKRMSSSIPKQYMNLLGKSVLEHSVQCLFAHPQIVGVMVVVAADDGYWPGVAAKLPSQKLLTTVGAEERYLSVFRGLVALQQKAQPQDWVLVHDAVRPCLTMSDLERLITQVMPHPVGGLLGSRVNDTLKRSDDQGIVISTVDRTNIWQAYTPQMFRFEILLKALQEVIAHQQIVTDDASAVELLGEPVLMVQGRQDNIKITQAEDLLWAERILQHAHWSRF